MVESGRRENDEDSAGSRAWYVSGRWLELLYVGRGVYFQLSCFKRHTLFASVRDARDTSLGLVGYGRVLGAWRGRLIPSCRIRSRTTARYARARETCR